MYWLKIYLPLYLIIYLCIAFALPSYKIYKKTGINPVTFGTSENAHDYIGRVMKILIGLLIATVAVFSEGDSWYAYLVPVDYLEKEWFKIIGLAIAHIALIWICIAQYQMGVSWRIGIDEENKTDLVTHGIFSISRNPIFLGMILTMLGVFLIIPNIITFFLALTSYFIIQIQIRLEEEFLEKIHGAAYQDYKQRTRRLI